jgi:hypothetical protein
MAYYACNAVISNPTLTYDKKKELIHELCYGIVSGSTEVDETAINENL